MTTTPLIRQLVDTMITNRWFWFGEGLPDTDEAKELKQITLTKIDKYIEQHYIVEYGDIEIHDAADEHIVALKNAGYVTILFCLVFGPTSDPCLV